MNHTSVEAALRELATEAFWSEERLRSLRARIPPYRLSKFQDALPDAALTEMLGEVFIDVAGARLVASLAIDVSRPRSAL